MTDEEKRDWLRPKVSWGLGLARMPYIDSPRPYYPEQVEGVIDSLIKCGITPEIFVKIKELQSENAALRERLDKAVELPVKIGDKVYQVYDKCDGRNCPYNGYYGQWRCSYEGKQRCKPFIDVKSFCYDDIPRINKTVFVSKEAAEKRLAEIEGGGGK